MRSYCVERSRAYTKYARLRPPCPSTMIGCVKAKRKRTAFLVVRFTACQKSRWLFCTLQIRHIFCEAYASRKISLRSSKSLMAQAFLMAIIQLEAGLAPSSSPAARLYLLGSIGFLTVSKAHRLSGGALYFIRAEILKGIPSSCRFADFRICRGACPPRR